MLAEEEARGCGCEGGRSRLSREESASRVRRQSQTDHLKLPPVDETRLKATRSRRILRVSRNSGL